VKDVVAAFVKAIEHSDATGLFNITSGKYLSLREQAETIAELFWGCDSPPRIVERPDKDNHMDSFLYDISRARRELGWSPAYSFRDMLVDYRIEAASGRYSYLVDKRLAMLKST
jgi:UDP-glucose 4-epimerase